MDFLFTGLQFIATQAVEDRQFAGVSHMEAGVAVGGIGGTVRVGAVDGGMAVAVVVQVAQMASEMPMMAVMSMMAVDGVQRGLQMVVMISQDVVMGLGQVVLMIGLGEVVMRLQVMMGTVLVVMHLGLVMVSTVMMVADLRRLVVVAMMRLHCILDRQISRLGSLHFGLSNVLIERSLDKDRENAKNNHETQIHIFDLVNLQRFTWLLGTQLMSLLGKVNGFIPKAQ